MIYSMRSFEQLHSVPPTKLHHLQHRIHQTIITFLRLRLFLSLLEQARCDTLEVLLERSTLMIKLLIVHILRPVKEDRNINARKQPTPGEVGHHLLLQPRQLEVFGQAHELMELFEACEHGGVLEHVELVLVKVLEHLVESARVVGVDGKGLLVSFAGLGLCFGDLLDEFWGFEKYRFVAVAFEARVAEANLVDSGIEVPMRIVSGSSGL